MFGAMRLGTRSSVLVARSSLLGVVLACAPSTSNAMRLLEQGAVRIDGEKITNRIFMAGEEFLLHVGKRQVAKIITTV